MDADTTTTKEPAVGLAPADQQFILGLFEGAWRAGAFTTWEQRRQALRIEEQLRTNLDPFPGGGEGTDPPAT